MNKAQQEQVDRLATETRGPVAIFEGYTNKVIHAVTIDTREHEIFIDGTCRFMGFNRNVEFTY